MARSPYVQSQQAVTTQWRAELSATELDVLQFVIERTLRWQKEWETIPMRHFTDGVFSRAGERIVCGLRRRKASIIAAYQSLIDKGLLLHDKDGRCNRFAINLKALISGACTMAGLNIGKKYKQTVRTGTDRNPQSVSTGTDPSYKEQSVTNGLSDDTSPEEHSPAFSTSDIDNRIAQVRKDSAVRDGKRVAQAKHRLSKANARAVWLTALRTHCGDKTIIKHLATSDYIRLRQGVMFNHSPLSFAETVDWAVENWTDLKRNELAWIDDMPAVPDFGMFARMYKFFLRAMGEQHERQRGYRPLNERQQSKSASEVLQLNAKVEEMSKELEQEKILSAHHRRMAVSKGPRRRRIADKDRKEIEDLTFAPPVALT